jgi:hypothetical protein
MRPIVALLLLSLATAAPACSQQAEHADFEPVCTLNQFRACTVDAACQAAQQCVAPGIWSSCTCTILDAGYPEAAYPDASDASDATNPDASDATDPDASDATNPDATNPDASDATETDASDSDAT